MTVNDKLIRHQDKIVPWVTGWTGEQVHAPLTVAKAGQTLTSTTLRLGYEDGNENRERSGILWMREGVMRGGEPRLAHVSTYRQRSAMARRLCQVCGEKTTDDPMRWLVPRKLLMQRDGETTTPSAPTCATCIPIALALCPHLKVNDWVIGRVVEYQAWGVLGEGVFLDKDGQVQRVNNLSYRYGMTHPFIAPAAFLAKQQVVVWTKFTLEEN